MRLSRVDLVYMRVKRMQKNGLQAKSLSPKKISLKFEIIDLVSNRNWYYQHLCFLPSDWFFGSYMYSLINLIRMFLIRLSTSRVLERMIVRRHASTYRLLHQWFIHLALHPLLHEGRWMPSWSGVRWQRHICLWAHRTMCHLRSAASYVLPSSFSLQGGARGGVRSLNCNQHIT